MASTKEAKTVARIPSKRTDVKPVRSADAQVPLDVCDDELDVVADGQPGRMGKVDVGVHATRSVHASESVVAAARASGSGATDARDADAMDHRSDDVLAGTRMPPRHDEYLAQATGLREFGATGGHLDSMDAQRRALAATSTLWMPRPMAWSCTRPRCSRLTACRRRSSLSHPPLVMARTCSGVRPSAGACWA